MFVRDALALIRFPIVLIAFLATLTFSFLFFGTYPLSIALIVAADWFLINLLNRVTDVDEDTHNQVAGAARVQSWRSTLSAVLFAVWMSSWGAFLLIFPISRAAIVLRIAVQVVGLAYSIRLVPTPRRKPYFPGGFARVKEIYFAKNFGSAGLFIATCIGYPILLQRTHSAPSPFVLAMLFFFLFFEVTYEILYDLRDVEGDRAYSIPTFVVVHGERIAIRMIYAFLVIASVLLVIAFCLRAIGVRELLLLAAPAVQALFIRKRIPNISAAECVAITHLGSLLLTVFLVGTWVWQYLGLPTNIYLS